MLTPFDTALLKHQPDHLHVPTEAERLAAMPRRGLKLLAALVAFRLRPVRLVARPLADTRF